MKSRAKRAKANLRRRDAAPAESDHTFYGWLAQQPCCSCGTRTNVICVADMPMCDGRQLDKHWLEGCARQLEGRTGRFGRDQYDDRHMLEWVDHQIAVHRGRYEALGIVAATEPVLF